MAPLCVRRRNLHKILWGICKALSAVKNGKVLLSFLLTDLMDEQKDRRYADPFVHPC